VYTEEAAAYLKGLANDGCRIIKCDGSGLGRLESAYNEFWWDWGDKLADNRTSLIIDPPDGRIPRADLSDSRLRGNPTR
jgi:hypothetical protein